jgi:anti-sigma factor ChrR (cupin superfamily)
MTDYIDLFEDSNWQNAPEYSSETRKKVLHDEDSSKIILLKLPAGFFMAPHSHLMNEQHVILKGEYESEGKVYHEGVYRSFKAQQKHGPFKSKNGALVLVIWKA